MTIRLRRLPDGSLALDVTLLPSIGRFTVTVRYVRDMPEQAEREREAAKVEADVDELLDSVMRKIGAERVGVVRRRGVS